MDKIKNAEELRRHRESLRNAPFPVVWDFAHQMAKAEGEGLRYWRAFFRELFLISKIDRIQALKQFFELSDKIAKSSAEEFNVESYIPPRERILGEGTQFSSRVIARLFDEVLKPWFEGIEKQYYEPVSDSQAGASSSELNSQNTKPSSAHSMVSDFDGNNLKVPSLSVSNDDSITMKIREEVQKEFHRICENSMTMCSYVLNEDAFLEKVSGKVQKQFDQKSEKEREEKREKRKRREERRRRRRREESDSDCSLPPRKRDRSDFNSSTDNVGDTSVSTKPMGDEEKEDEGQEGSESPISSMMVAEVASTETSRRSSLHTSLTDQPANASGNEDMPESSSSSVMRQSPSPTSMERGKKRRMESSIPRIGPGEQFTNQQ